MCYNKVSGPLSKVLNEILRPPGWILSGVCVCVCVFEKREREMTRERETDGDACTHCTGRVFTKFRGEG